MKSAVHIAGFTSNPYLDTPGILEADFGRSIHSNGYTIHPGASWDGFGPGKNPIHAQSVFRTSDSIRMSINPCGIQSVQIRRVFCWREGSYFERFRSDLSPIDGFPRNSCDSRGAGHFGPF